MPGLRERAVRFAEHVKRRLVPLRYDAAEHPAEAYYAARYFARILPRLDALGDGPLKILDLGCGSGRFLVPLAEAGHRLVGVDRHRDSIRRVREKTERFGERAEIIDSSADDALRGLPENGFDAALTLEVIHTHPDRAAVTAAMYRCVRPGGLLFITHRPPSFFYWTAVRDGRWDDARLVLAESEGRLRKGHHRIHYNWQTVDRIRELYDSLGAELLELAPIGPASGFAGDPLESLCDPRTVLPGELERLAAVEDAAPETLLASSRYVLAVARKPGE